MTCREVLGPGGQSSVWFGQEHLSAPLVTVYSPLLDHRPAEGAGTRLCAVLLCISSTSRLLAQRTGGGHTRETVTVPPPTPSSQGPTRDRPLLPTRHLRQSPAAAGEPGSKPSQVPPTWVRGRALSALWWPLMAADRGSHTSVHSTVGQAAASKCQPPAITQSAASLPSLLRPHHQPGQPQGLLTSAPDRHCQRPFPDPSHRHGNTRAPCVTKPAARDPKKNCPWPDPRLFLYPFPTPNHVQRATASPTLLFSLLTNPSAALHPCPLAVAPSWSVPRWHHWHLTPSGHQEPRRRPPGHSSLACPHPALFLLHGFLPNRGRPDLPFPVLPLFPEALCPGHGPCLRAFHTSSVLTPPSRVCPAGRPSVLSSTSWLAPRREGLLCPSSCWGTNLGVVLEVFFSHPICEQTPGGAPVTIHVSLWLLGPPPTLQAGLTGVKPVRRPQCRALHSAEGSLVGVSKFFMVFEQGVLHFHFVLGPENDAAGPACRGSLTHSSASQVTPRLPGPLSSTPDASLGMVLKGRCHDHSPLPCLSAGFPCH